MKIVIIGATGRVGSHVKNEALQRGHLVTAIARETKDITPQERLSIASADVENIDNVVSLIKGHDAVVSTFNTNLDRPDLHEYFIKSSENIQNAVRQSGVKRFLVVGGAGSLFINGRQIVDGPEFPKPWLAGAQAARDYLNIIKQETELDWTFLSPAIFLHFNAARTGAYRVNYESPVCDNTGKSEISAEDLAVAIIDELENGSHIKKRFTVGY